MAIINGELPLMLRKEEAKAAAIVKRQLTRNGFAKDVSEPAGEVKIIEMVGKVEDVEMRITKKIRRFV